MIEIKRAKNVKRQYIKIPAGGRNLRALLLTPEGGEGDRPGVLWLHGGGYVTGMPEMAYATRAMDLASLGGAVVLLPAYGLSLRNPYPAGLHDCYAALCYMKDNASKLGIRDDQLMVGGESAGGGLTAALCMYAHDLGEVNIAFQMPLYPMLDCFDTDSSRDNHAKVWDTRRNHMAWRLYLRRLPKNAPVPAYASPSRREDLSGLPPCYTFVGGLEPFRDETAAFVERLKSSGVPAEIDIYPGFYHAYDVMRPKTEASQLAARRFLTKFIEARHLYTAPQK